MSTFQDFIASRVLELDYRDSRSETFLKEATIRQLRELSRYPVDFLDGSYSFNTVADQDNYGSGHLNFPVDLYSWAGRPYVTTSSDPVTLKHFIEGPAPIEDVRSRGQFGTLSGLYPDVFAWFNRFMWIAPRPTGVTTIQGDYRRDGRRDTASGDLITTASTTHTNGWFDEGENALRCAVMLEYHETISKDGKSIQLYRDQLFGSQDGKKPGIISILKKARSAKRSGLMQTDDSMFRDGPAVNRKTAWRWA